MPSSGRGGPCCHCKATESHCWRRGPPSKPILCNACGSRYLVKRSLEGYQPLAMRGMIKQRASKVSAPALLRARPTRRDSKRLRDASIDSMSSGASLEAVTDPVVLVKPKLLVKSQLTFRTHLRKLVLPQRSPIF
ncbi:hypothetical protein ACKKBG_A08950 [Auxenochlorella protothecoides x Auxenochlorella symbiontica]